MPPCGEYSRKNAARKSLSAERLAESEGQTIKRQTIKSPVEPGFSVFAAEQQKLLLGWRAAFNLGAVVFDEVALAGAGEQTGAGISQDY